MSHSICKLFERISALIPKIDIHWSYLWVEEDGYAYILSTTGILWDTGTITFNDSDLYGGPRRIGQLSLGARVQKVQVKRSLLGPPKLFVSTMYDQDFDI